MKKTIFIFLIQVPDILFITMRKKIEVEFYYNISSLHDPPESRKDTKADSFIAFRV